MRYMWERNARRNDGGICGRNRKKCGERWGNLCEKWGRFEGIKRTDAVNMGENMWGIRGMRVKCGAWYVVH